MENKNKPFSIALLVNLTHKPLTMFSIFDDQFKSLF